MGKSKPIYDNLGEFIGDLITNFDDLCRFVGFDKGLSEHKRELLKEFLIPDIRAKIKELEKRVNDINLIWQPRTMSIKDKDGKDYDYFYPSTVITMILEHLNLVYEPPESRDGRLVKKEK